MKQSRASPCRHSRLCSGHTVIAHRRLRPKRALQTEEAARIGAHPKISRLRIPAAAQTRSARLKLLVEKQTLDMEHGRTLLNLENDQMGGMVKAIESGLSPEEIAEASFRYPTARFDATRRLRVRQSAEMIFWSRVPSVDMVRQAHRKAYLAAAASSPRPGGAGHHQVRDVLGNPPIRDAALSRCAFRWVRQCSVAR